MATLVTSCSKKLLTEERLLATEDNGGAGNDGKRRKVRQVLASRIPAFAVERYNLFTRNILSRLDVVNILKAFLFGFQGFVVNLLFYPHAQCQLD